MRDAAETSRQFLLLNLLHLLIIWLKVEAAGMEESCMWPFVIGIEDRVLQLRFQAAPNGHELEFERKRYKQKKKVSLSPALAVIISQMLIN